MELTARRCRPVTVLLIRHRQWPYPQRAATMTGWDTPETLQQTDLRRTILQAPDLWEMSPRSGVGSTTSPIPTGGSVVSGDAEEELDHLDTSLTTDSLPDRGG
jgi:hypothetical protein